jgi:pyruvate dehydrogenase kinase 2/3/4
LLVRALAAAAAQSARERLCLVCLPTCAEELPIRLAHRVKELDELPNGLNEMPSIIRVKDWYAQSFEVCRDPSLLRVASSCQLEASSDTLGDLQELVKFPPPQLPDAIRAELSESVSRNPASLPGSTPNPSLSAEGAELEEGRDAAMSSWRMRERARNIAADSAASDDGKVGDDVVAELGGPKDRKRQPIDRR